MFQKKKIDCLDLALSPEDGKRYQRSKLMAVSSDLALSIAGSTFLTDLAGGSLMVGMLSEYYIVYMKVKTN